MTLFLRLGTDGWFCATKGKMVFPLGGFCWSASFLFSKCISERTKLIWISRLPFYWSYVSFFLCNGLPRRFEAFSHSVKLPIKGFVLVSKVTTQDFSYIKKQSLENSFPSIDSRLKQVFFCFFQPPEVVNFRLKSLLETIFAQSKQICSLNDGDTHTRSIDLVGVESVHSAMEFKN